MCRNIVLTDLKFVRDDSSEFFYGDIQCSVYKEQCQEQTQKPSLIVIIRMYMFLVALSTPVLGMLSD